MKSWLKKLLIVLAVACMVPPVAYAAGQTVSGAVSMTASFGESVSSGLINAETIQQAIQQTDNYSAGTASGQVDTFYAAQIALAAGSPQTLSLDALTDPAGKVANFARVRELIVQNTASTAGYDVTISGGAANPVAWLPASGSGTPCRYGSVFRISDKLSTGASNGNVIGGSAKTIQLSSGSNAVTVNVLIVGCSAQ